MPVNEIHVNIIVKQVGYWLANYRLALAQEILRTLMPTSARPTTQSKTLNQALGLLSTETPPLLMT